MDPRKLRYCCPLDKPRNIYNISYANLKMSRCANLIVIFVKFAINIKLIRYIHAKSVQTLFARHTFYTMAVRVRIIYTLNPV